MKTQIAPFKRDGIKLRPLERRDLSMTLAWRNRDDVRVWFKMSDVVTDEQHLAWFESYLAKPNDYVFIVEAQDTPVGQVAIYGIDANGSAEIGRFIAAPGENGKGHMRSAIDGLLDLAKQQWGLSHVYLQVFAHNERAIGLYQRLGFKIDKAAEDMLQLSMSTDR